MRPLLTPLRLLSAVLATTLAGAGPPVPALAAPARTGSPLHCVVSLTGFPFEASPTTDPFYYTLEAQERAAFSVWTRNEFDCNDQGNSDPWVGYHTEDGLAVAPDDYEAQNGRTDPLTQGVATELIPVVNNPDIDPVVRDFRIVLDSAEAPWFLSHPDEASVYIIDDEGPTRVAFREASVIQSETRTSVRIPVFMAGPVGGDIPVGFTVEPGPTNPATPGEDYHPPSVTSLTFGPSARVRLIQFSIINDTEIEDAETIEISLDPGPGYELATPSVLILTIQDNDRDFISPTSWFHHPRHGKTYPYGDFRLREMHVFFDDEGSPPSGVVAVDMALRKKKLNGSCTWWYKGRWAAGSCSSKRWLPMTFDFDLYLRRFPALRPSVGTRIKNYTAWCRAIDGAGNVQTEFVKSFKRGSWNTFEVARP